MRQERCQILLLPSALREEATQSGKYNEQRASYFRLEQERTDLPDFWMLQPKIYGVVRHA